MSWRTIDITEVRLTPAETAAMQHIQDSEDIGATKLTDVIGEFRDAIETAGTALSSTDGTVPDRIRNHVVNRTRWLWLCEFPQLKAFQTADRSKLNDAAEQALKDISSGALKVPPGDGSSADQTNSPSFGTRGGTRDEDPPERDFTREKQDGI